jgi:hypothetical protein
MTGILIPSIVKRQRAISFFTQYFFMGTVNGLPLMHKKKTPPIALPVLCMPHFFKQNSAGSMVHETITKCRY